MKDEDLQFFAAADGLRRQMLENPGRLSDAERVELLDRARHVLARELGVSPDDAYRAMYTAANHGDVEVRCGDQFAAVLGWGRVIHCATRAELRGVCHPDLN
jgi:hypothetical protein